jgi:NAD-dependent deacetylase
MTEKSIELAAQWIHDSQDIVILTGAGVSKESGVPTFRDGEGSLWEQYDPMEIATHRALQEKPKVVWDFYQYRLNKMGDAKPNSGHYAIAKLQDFKTSIPIITQNIDDLHEQAGSKDVIHLHGRINSYKCMANCKDDPTPLDISNLPYEDKTQPPKCPYCGAFVRPNVVLFGEILPEPELNRAEELSLKCDLMIVIGTSGLVSPADSLPKKAKRNSATIIEINPAYSMITRFADLKIEAPSGIIMPQIIAALETLRQGTKSHE